jgi:HEAT repeat protein
MPSQRPTGAPAAGWRCAALLLLAAALALPASAQEQAQEQAPAPLALNVTERAQLILDEALRDKNPDTRRHGVQALGLIGPREPWAGQLRTMLGDKDVEVRMAAVATLVDLRDKDTVPALVKALDDEVPEVSFAAAKALWSLGEPAGRDALVAVLSGDARVSSGFFTSKKREALRMFQTPRTMFMFVLKQGVGMAGVSGLGAGVSSLEGVLSANGTSGRAATALMLSGDPDPMVKAALLDALRDEDWPVRAAAAHAIALRNDPSLQEQLLPLLDDKQLAVRVRAAAAWLRLGMIEVKPPEPPKPPRKKPRKRREG